MYIDFQQNRVCRSETARPPTTPRNVETYVEPSISVRIAADRQCFGTATDAGRVNPECLVVVGH